MSIARFAKLGAGALAALLALFFGFAWSIDTDPLRGLYNLLKPTDSPAAGNPALVDVLDYRVSWLGDLESRRLAESSGLTASQLHPGVLWSINDSGGDPELFALDETGKHLAIISLPGLEAFDWESLDSFEHDGRSYIAIGDIGDNLGWRRQVRIIVVPEPELLVDGLAEPAWEVSFVYPDGARDSESMAVDVKEHRILILSKRDQPPRLYSVPVKAQGPVVATHLADLDHLPRLTQEDLEEELDGAQYRHMPSGMDYHAPTDRLLLTTLKHAYIYLLGDITKSPVRVRLPTAGQREAITWVHAQRAIVSRERPDQKGDAELYEIAFSPRAAYAVPGADSPSER